MRRDSREEALTFVLVTITFKSLSVLKIFQSFFHITGRFRIHIWPLACHSFLHIPKPYPPAPTCAPPLRSLFQPYSPPPTPYVTSKVRSVIS